MIELIVNDTALELNPDTKIRVEWNNPVFAEEVIESSKVYWFDIPVNSVNNKALNHINIVGMSSKYQLYEGVYLKLFRLIEMKGTLIVKNIDTKFRAAFTSNDFSQYNETLLTDFDWGDDITMGTTTQDVIDHANAKVAQSYPNTNYNFPMIYNPGFYGNKNITYKDHINIYDVLSPGFFNNNIWPTYLSEGEQDYPLYVKNYSTLVPIFYLQWLLSKLADNLNFVFSGELLTGTDFQQLMVYNGYSLDGNENEYYVEASEGGRDTIDTDVLKFTTIEKGTKATYDGKDFTVDYYGFHGFYLRVRCTTATPGTTQLKISIYNKTAATEITSYQIDAADTTAEEILVIDYDHHFVQADIGDAIQMKITSDTSWIIEEMECAISNASQTLLNRYAKTISPGNHVPQMKMKDFLKDLKVFFGMSYFIDNSGKKMQFSFLKDILNSGYYDITHKIRERQEISVIEKKNISIDFEWDESDNATQDNFLETEGLTNVGTFNQVNEAPHPINPKEIIKVIVSNNYHKCGYEDETLIRRWLFFSDIKQKQYIDKDASQTDEIKIKANPLLMYSKPNIDVTTLTNFMKYNQYPYILPQIDKKGYSAIYGEKKLEEEKLRLLNWVGLIEYTAYEGTLPDDPFVVQNEYPFATSVNYDIDNVKQKDITLFLEGTDGLYNNFLKQWYEFISSIEEVVFDAGVNFGVADLLKLIEVAYKPQNGATTSNTRWIMIENIKYLPKQITAEITMQGLESVEIKAIKQAH